jgi:predicted aspartyl protease
MLYLRLRRLPLVSLAALATAFAAGCSPGAPASAPALTPASVPANDAAALFARYKAATGGAAWDAVAALETDGKIATGGLTGTMTSIEDDRTGKSVLRFSLGPIQGANGFDGTTPWEQGPGGEVTAHDAPEALELARTDAWVTTRGFLKPDFDQATVTPPREQLEGGTRYLVVEATPKGGRTIAFWFDPQTALPVRTVLRRETKIATTVLSDYRETAGLRLPFHSAQDSTDSAGRTDPREHLEITVDHVTVNPKVDDAAFAAPKMAATAHIEDPSGVTRVPFQLVNNHIYADGLVDGKPAHFLVDTGGMNILTPASAARLGLTSEGKLAAGGVGDEQVDLALTHASEVRVGGAVLANPVFYVIDLGSLGAVEGVTEDGLVGFEMFRRFRVTVDYAARILTLTDPAKFTPPEGAHAVPFDLADSIPVITGKLDGLPVRISVDTGSRASLTLHSPFVREHDLAKRYGAASERVTGWGVGGPSKGRPARLGTLEIGDLAIRDIAADLNMSNKGAFANPDLSANLGGGVLKRFRVSFDYDARKMYLVPNADFAKPDSFDRSGMWVLGDGDALKIAALAPGAAAEKAGLKVGDRIVALGGEATKTRTIGEWRVRLCEQAAGTHVALRVASEGSERKVDLVLADAIPAHVIPAP